MRVIVLSQYYDPEPLPKPGELARELAARGHDVQVLTGYPNYPTGILYPGFNLRPVDRSREGGVSLLRTFEYPYHGKNVLLRVAHYGSFMVSAVFGAILLRNADVMYVWHPPLTIGLTAWLISRLRRVPFVYDVQDIWPDSVLLSGLIKKGFLFRLMRGIERFVYRKATHVFVVSEGARRNLIRKGVPPEKISVMPHWIDDAMADPVDVAVRSGLRDQFGWGSRKVVMFAGNIGIVQGLDTVVDAAAAMTPDEKVLFVLVGDGSDRNRLEDLVRRRGLEDRIQFLGRRPMEEMPAFLAASDILLVHLKPSDLSREAIPTKTLAYLAAGRPILMAMEGAAADLVGEAGAGICARPGDSRDLLRAVRALASLSDDESRTMGNLGREYVVGHLTRSKVVEQYEQVLSSVARKGEAG